MTSVLITAFEPYADWSENSSWLTLVELTKNLPETPQVTTRLYPVDLAVVRQKLAADLADNYDYALHLGQSPGSGQVCLEAIGINVADESCRQPEDHRPLVADGPVAYQSPLPLANWASKLRQAKIPSRVSHHAGTYLCNATLYLSQYLAERDGLKTRSTLVHLPLDISQALHLDRDCAALPRTTLAAAIRLILDELALLDVR
jgi:pyroglutamyl-peptidase